MSQIKLFHEFEKSYLGKFIFINSQEINNLIKMLTSGEFMKTLVISTYIKSNGFLGYQNSNKEFNKRDLKQVLSTSKGIAVKTFLKSTLDNNILIEDDNKYSLNTQYFYKGSMKKLKSNGKNYIRLYTKSIQLLYKKYLISPKKLLPIFQLLPYCNKKYNILCKNPNEITYEHIEPLTMKNMNDILHRNPTDMCKLRKNILSTTYDNQFVIIKKDNCFLLNPLISYQSNNLQELQNLMQIFESNMIDKI
jgi:hypothetical protein